jgi:sugar/nucleoside kinase (ribokinase family)
MKKYDAVIAGYTCVDMIPDFKKNESLTHISDLLKPGKLIEIDGLNIILGGVVPNTGLAMKKFDKKVFLNGLIGDDFIGKIAKEWLDRYNISDELAVTKEAGTAFSIVIAPPGVDRIFLESPGCNQIFDSSYINFDIVSQSRIFHLGYPPLLRQFYLNGGSQLQDLFSKIRNMGVITSLDFSLPDPETESGKVNWPEIMKNILPVTDIFVPSVEEALQILFPLKYAEIQSSVGDGEIIDHIGIDLIRILGKRIIDLGVKIVLIKMAHRGAYLLTGDISSLIGKLDLKLSVKNWNYRELLCNAYHADNLKIKNATAAGDTAVAAFLSAILDGEGPEYALKYAAMTGRNKLYCTNIYEDLTGWQEMTDEIRSTDKKLVHFKVV